MVKRTEIKKTEIRIPERFFGSLSIKRLLEILPKATFKPNFSKLAKKEKMSITTIFSAWAKLNKDYDVRLILEIKNKEE